jgi:hypothetical protein
MVHNVLCLKKAHRRPFGLNRTLARCPKLANANANANAEPGTGAIGDRAEKEQMLLVAEQAALNSRW